MAALDPDAVLTSPAVAAVHAARSALTVVGGRAALAQRHADHGGIERVIDDLAVIRAQLADIAEAVDQLAAAAAECEPNSLLGLIASPTLRRDD